MTTQSTSRTRKAMKRLRASFRGIRRCCGEINERQKRVVHHTFTLLETSLPTQPRSRRESSYLKLLKEVLKLSGIEMAVLCAIALTGSRLKIEDLIGDLPTEIQKKSLAWDRFLLQRIVREHCPSSTKLIATPPPRATWTSMPNYDPDREGIGCVDYDRHKFEVYFKEIDDMTWPDISVFPQMPHSRAYQSPYERLLWTRSTPIALGAYSHVRLLENCSGRFPVLKMANDDMLSRELIRKEYWNYMRFRGMDLPVADVCSRPLKDERGIFGFRMEKLEKIAIRHIGAHLSSLKAAVSSFHRSNIVHGDLSSSNLMLDSDRRLKLIDLSHAQNVGELLPEYDEERLKRIEVGLF